MHTVTIAACLLAATTAQASIRVTLNGEPAKNAEVCAFKAAGEDTPFRQFLASNEIVCNASLAPGLWNIFARRGNEFVSARTVLVDTGKALGDVELRLEPAAIVTFTNRPERAHGVVYLTDTASAFPAGADGTALVPADRDLVPLLALDATPVAVGEPLRLTVHAKKSIALDPKSTHAIATWVTIAAADLEALRTVRRKQPPQVAMRRGTRLQPVVNPIRGTVVLNGAMQFIRDVPEGVATLELSGVPWKHQVATVVVPATGVAVTASPLMLVPTSSAIVKWVARRNLNDLASGVRRGCRRSDDESGGTTAAPKISLLSCRGVQTTRSLPILDRERCTVAGAHEWPPQQQSGEIAFENLGAGAYVVEFTFGDLPPVREAIRLERFEQQPIGLDVDYTTLYGRVTAGGQTLSSPARLSFQFAYDAYSDKDGNYTVVMPKPLTVGNVVSVRTCDGTLSGEQIVDRDVLPNSRYDIDLAANSIIVEAVDEDSGAPIVNALVRYGAFRNEDMSSVYYFRLAFSDGGANAITSRTDTEGRYTIRSLPPEKTLRVCLEHDDYERTCADPLQLSSTEEQTLRVAMKRKDGFSGRIDGVSDIAAGQVYWFAPDGRETERTAVKADGSFRFNRQHEPGEAVVFVSANHPLFAFAQPSVAAGEEMLVTQPAAATRTFTISIGENNAQSDALVTIAIGSLVVPYPPFVQHLALHGSQLDLRNRGPLLIPDILETAPISAILGPPLSEVTPGMRVIDVFRLPQYRALPRKPLTADGQVVF